MQELILLIIALIVIAVIVSAIVLPIVALIISIRSRRILNAKVSQLEAGQFPISGGLQQPAAEGSLAQSVQQLVARVQRLEVTLTAHSIFPEGDPRRDPDIKSREPRPEPAQTPSTTTPQPPGAVLPDVAPSVSEPTQPAFVPDAASATEPHRACQPD